MFKEILEVNTGGQTSGKLEMKKLNIDSAISFNKSIFDINIENFKSNFEYAKKRVKLGRTKRKDMPVITSRDVQLFRSILISGTMNSHLDLDFNVGKVDIKTKKVKVKTLIPIQNQMYFDKSMTGIAKNGIPKTRKFLRDVTYFITSSDHNIIDGHHRWLQAMLIDPEMEVQIMEINLPINKLLPISVNYGDYIGNERNK